MTLLPLALTLTLLIVGFALRVLEAKRRRGPTVQARGTALPFDPRPSILSEAMAGLLGTAGAIYLVLMMTMGFVGVPTPWKVNLWQAQIDVVAVGSLIVAGVQPVISRWIK